MSSEVLLSNTIPFAGSGLVGYAIGFALKKILKFYLKRCGFHNDHFEHPTMPSLVFMDGKSSGHFNTVAILISPKDCYWSVLVVISNNGTSVIDC
jgi:hypothetical protein